MRFQGSAKRIVGDETKSRMIDMPLIPGQTHTPEMASTRVMLGCVDEGTIKMCKETWYSGNQTCKRMKERAEKIVQAL